MEAWRAWIRRHKIVSLKYRRGKSSCRPKLTRVPSSKRNRTGPKPSWKRRKHPTRRRDRQIGLGTIQKEEEHVRISSLEEELKN
jgi:hypothetical protein